MDGGLSWLLIALLAACLGYAALRDWQSRIIPNWLNGVIAALAIPFWWATGLALWPDVAIQAGVAAALFGAFAIAFHMGAMGGGDVKLLSAVALWLSPLAVMKLLIVMSLAGGALTVAMVVRHRLAKSGDALEIPYGMAIAFGGFWLITERFLNHFG